MFIYLFIYLAAMGLSRGMRDFHCGMLDLLLWRAFLSTCGTQAPESVGSVVAAHELSCPAVCGILIPQPGI